MSKTIFAPYPDWIRIDRNGTMHFDAIRYAELRGISLDQAEAEIRKMCSELLPGTPIKTVK